MHPGQCATNAHVQIPRRDRRHTFCEGCVRRGVGGGGANAMRGHCVVAASGLARRDRGMQSAPTRDDGSCPDSASRLQARLSECVLK